MAGRAYLPSWSSGLSGTQPAPKPRRYTDGASAGGPGDDGYSVPRACAVAGVHCACPGEHGGAEVLDLAARRAPVKAKGSKPRTRRRGAPREDYVMEPVH